jgi:pantoate--beta-alanine ligase
MRVIRSAAEMQAAALCWRRAGRRVALVPTMGALHAGHLSLLARARPLCDTLVVSLFVNPAQFEARTDLRRYPRSPAADALGCREAGADVLFAPAVSEIYPPGFCTWVEPAGPALGYEGKARPGHFRGVATVVLKLLQLTLPDVAVFGQKDAQQVAVIARLIRDFHLPVRLEVVSTVREADGLAMSSRNRLLDRNARRAASGLYAALAAARERYAAGERAGERLRRALRDALARERRLRIEYADLVDPETFEPAARPLSSSLLIAAARLGGVRLIDNLALGAAPRDARPAPPPAPRVGPPAPPRSGPARRWRERRAPKAPR